MPILINAVIEIPMKECNEFKKKMKCKLREIERKWNKLDHSPSRLARSANAAVDVIWRNKSTQVLNHVRILTKVNHLMNLSE